MTTQDLHLEVSRLQNLISRQLGLPLDRLIFDYAQKKKGIKLDLFTINPRHDESFLFHSISGETKVDVLQEMLDYAAKSSQQEQSFTVQWTQRGSGELHTSYFRAHSMYEVLDKFFHGREKHEYVLFSITMNPIA